MESNGLSGDVDGEEKVELVGTEETTGAGHVTASENGGPD